MTETAQTVKDVVDTIMPYLSAAAEQLGTTAAYLWQLQVKQAYVFGIVGTIKYIVWIALCCVGYKVIKYFVKNYNEKNQLYTEGELTFKQFDNATEGCIYIPFIIVAVAFGLYLSLPSLNELATVFINPEYWALNQVISLLKGSIKF